MTDERLTLEQVRLVKPPRRNKENIRLWVEALRSKKFLQTRNYLASQTEKGSRWRHCCLGVACEVADVESVDTMRQGFGTLSSPDKMREYGDLGSGYDLPDEVISWLNIAPKALDKFEDYRDIPIKIVSGPNKGNTTTLIGLNDDEEWTFEMIADLIERDWL